MNHKVLLADDSLTIQKVIKITLANQPFDIVDCSNEDQLFNQLPIVQPKIVFLDFNLSEKFTGYELTTKIKSICPSAKVLLLLGTFDTVDDATMAKCGASDKIVKPFDSNKFIAICKQLIETFADGEEIPYPTSPEAKSNDKVSIDNPEDQWQVNHSTEQKLEVKEVPLDNSFPIMENPLEKEVSDWGMSVPSIISDTSTDNNMMDLPPVIELKQNKPQLVQKEVKPENQKFPSTDDLDYPAMDTAASSAPKSNLISLDQLNKPLDLEIERSFEKLNDTDLSSLVDQIEDEVKDNLWQADEFEDLKKEVSSKIEEVHNNFNSQEVNFDDSFLSPLDSNDSLEWNETPNSFKANADHDFSTQIDKSELESLVKKYVKEYMDEMFKKDVEKVAWEVIPDLAENLIRQELSKISNKVIND